jgi:hypothetical protein
VANSDAFDWPRIASRIRVIARHIESLDERASRAEGKFIKKSNFQSDAARELQLAEQATGATLVRRFALGAKALPPKAPQKDLSSISLADLFAPPPAARPAKKKGKKK